MESVLQRDGHQFDTSVETDGLEWTLLWWSQYGVGGGLIPETVRVKFTVPSELTIPVSLSLSLSVSGCLSPYVTDGPTVQAVLCGRKIDSMDCMVI